MTVTAGTLDAGTLASLARDNLVRRSYNPPKNTRFLSQPTLNSKHIAFVYADDLWVADLDGKNVRRLTSDIGVELNPVLSPGGKTLADSAQYDGNTDVYSLPTVVGSSCMGGAPEESVRSS